jgi:endonuclease/exonuclease/phosphatase family metal-dependent hydrolase
MHGAVGRDGVFAPERIAAVLEEIGAGVVALQEVESGELGRDILGQFRARLGVESIAGPTLLRADGHFGNALLTRYPIVEVATLDLTVPPHEPRGALDVILDCRGAQLRVVATHLGLWPYERRRQTRKLLERLGHRSDLPTVLMGDLNEWYLWGRTLKWLHAHFRETPAPATFPARRPVFALDRLWVRPHDLLRQLRVHASPLARKASDHLPLVALLGDAVSTSHGG